MQTSHAPRLAATGSEQTIPTTSIGIDLDTPADKAASRALLHALS